MDPKGGIMPNELDTLMEKRVNDQKEFEDTFEDILGKTDEEIEESLKKDREAEEAAKASGEATGEQSKEANTSDYSFDKNQTEGSDPKPAVDPVPDTTNKEVNWQQKYTELESELSKEKQRTASWDGRIKAANEKSKKLEEQVAILVKEREEKVQAKTAQQDMSDKEKMDLFRENFPELADFADIMERKLNAIKAPAPAKVETPAEEDTSKPTAPAPAKAAEQSSGPSPHYVAITKIHPDLDEIVNSGKLLSWINQQAEYIRPHLSKVYNSGTSDEVISVVTEFKNKTGWKSAVAPNPKQDKLNSMLETEGESPGPKAGEPDKNDFAGTAKEIGL
jgi:hypothetical protein